MSVLKPFETIEVELFSLYLEQIAEILSKDVSDYGLQFEVKAFQLENAAFSTHQTMLAAYPKSRPDQAIITSSSLQDMTRVVNGCLCFHKPYDAAGPFDIRGPYISQATQQKICADYWNFLGDCIDYERATLFSYRLPYICRDYLPLFPGIWEYVFIIHNAAQERCVILYGAACD